MPDTHIVMLRPIAFVFSRNCPLWLYCLLAGATAFGGSYLLSESVGALLGAFNIDTAALSPAAFRKDAMGYLLVVLASPLLESLLLAGTLKLTTYLTDKPLRQASMAAVVWALLHALAAPMWFFGVLFSFFIFALGFVIWRPVSWWAAYAAAAIPHMLVNLVAMTFVD